jgi:hypothetical protein
VPKGKKGRPPGSKNKRTLARREFVEVMLHGKMQPFEVVHEAMMAAYDSAKHSAQVRRLDPELSEQERAAVFPDYGKAVEYALPLIPYTMAKVTPDKEGADATPTVSVEERNAAFKLFVDVLNKVAAAKADPYVPRTEPAGDKPRIVEYKLT